MITLINGMILIDNVITTNPEYIGLALLDYAEQKHWRMMVKPLF